MKIKKLDARGFSHDLVIVAFVVIFAIAGVGYLVASHADTCPAVSGAASDAASNTSSGSCPPASGAVSSPTLVGSCTLNGVPANPTSGQQLAPTVTFTNSGSQSIAVNATGSGDVFGDNNAKSNSFSSPVAATTLQSGRAATVDTGLHYTVGYSSTTARKVTFTVINTTPFFSCSATATLPAAPVGTPAPPPPSKPPVKLAGACSISGVPSRPSYRQVIRPTLTVTNTGTGAFQPKITERLLTSGRTLKTVSRTLATLNPRASAKTALSQYTVPHRSGNTTQGTYLVSSAQPGFSCSATFRLP